MFGIIPIKNNKMQERGSIFDIDSIISDFFSDTFMGFAGGNSIKADIKETEKEFVIDAEIPGAKKEDIKLDLREDRLIISIEKSEETKEEKDNYIRKERRSGAASRSFLVENVNHEGVTAKYENGILSIVLPKNETKKANSKIDIQ